MTEKRALVTGGGKRLGRFMALHLAERGHDVAVHYHASSQGAEEVAAEIERLGRRAALVQADLLDEDATAGLVDRAAGALGGPLNLLVNNASIFERDSLATVTRESWDRHMQSNLRAPFVLLQRFAAQAPRAFLDHRGEVMPQALAVNIIDQRVWRPSPEYMSYTLAKMALWALTQTAAQALAREVRVNAIGPGWTMHDPGQSDADFLRARAAVTPGRPPNPEDICGALGYLLEAPSVTGQMIAVDGAQHLDWPSRRG
jgi:NAD(P)-dependent dehydrogenase (short-subunit alcohol dehydrogenase family)